MTCEYADMNWDWLVGQAKQNDRQNRLGFVVTLAGELAERSGDASRSEKLKRYRELLDLFSVWYGKTRSAVIP